MVLKVLAIAVTASYCLVIFLAEGIYIAMMPAQFARELSLVWRIAVGAEIPFPWHALLWQLPAIISMCWVLWGDRTGLSSPAWPVDRRLLAHVVVVLTLVCLAGAALIVPMVEISYVLK